MATTDAFSTLPENGSLAYEVFWKPLLENPKINALPFTLHTGKIGKELYFDTEFTDTPTIKATCGWDWKDGTAVTKKALDPIELDFSFKQCYTDFVKSIWGDKLPDGWRKGELFPEVIDRIVTKQSNAFNSNLLTALFLADEGSSFPWLAGFDGVYAKLLAGATAVDGTVDANVTIDSTALLPANIETTLNSIYIQQPDLMKSFDNSQKVWIVTQTVYEAWRRYVQIGTATGGNIPDRASILGGIDALEYQGIKMINASYVDRGLALYDLTGSPAAVANPNRVILTIPSNHHIMIDGSGFEMIEPFYDRKDDIVYSPASAMIDYQYAFGEFNVFSGF
jgi:hypothetical protein